MSGETESTTTFSPFIYDCRKSIGVFDETLKYIESTGLNERIRRAGWVLQNAGGMVPQHAESLWSGHFFPYVEATDELAVSLNLALFGFYKQSMVSLRAGLELGLLSVYWNLNDDGHIAVKSWLRSNEETPRLGDIWRKFESHPNFAFVQSKYDLRKRLLDLGTLSNYVHSKGYRYSNRFGLKFKPNFQIFSDDAFKKWLSQFEEVVRVIVILHLIKYPLGAFRYDYYSKFGIEEPWIGILDEAFVDQIESFIEPEIFQIVEELVRIDLYAKGVVAFVEGLPDLSEDELEKKMVDFDKSLIRSSGWNNWIKLQNQTVSILSDPAPRLARIELLRVWAEENGLLKE
ncbi:MAG: hypothetical protein IPH75_10310 [bacterium]|nr:hypothetical protein [bacterium]